MKRLLSVLCILAYCTVSAVFPVLANESTVYPSFSFYRENGTVVETSARSTVDFSTGTTLNSDLIGWFCGESLQEGFPVMAGTKDNKYIKRTWLGAQKNGRSCVFIPYGGERDFSESTPVLYGSTDQKAPFACMKVLQSQSGYEAQPYFRLLTPQGDYQLDIFAVLKKTAKSNEELTPPADAPAFEAWLTSILAESLVSPLEECIPSCGERILILSSTSEKKRNVLLAAMRPLRYDTEFSFDYTKYQLDSQPILSHTEQISGLREVYVYYQKDELWADMRFESRLTSKYRHLSGGSCGPFALANLLVNIAAKEDLAPLLEGKGDGQGVLFCPCSVNLLYCSQTHIPYHIQTIDELIRYLPVVLCNFAAGNNPWGVTSRKSNGYGTDTLFVPKVCEALGFTCIPVDTLKEGVDLVKAGGNRGGLLCCAQSSSPFSMPSNTHFVSIIGVADGHVYVLDSIYKKSYTVKSKNFVKIGEGVGRFPENELTGASLSPIYYIEKPDNSPLQ